MNASGGCGWIKAKGNPDDFGRYLSTHTFYGANHRESTRVLRKCGWNVTCANWDDVTGVASHALFAPFVAVAKGIPDNWPGGCILRFDQRNDGSIYLSYHGINDASHGITINQWRALLGANALGSGDGEEITL